MRAIVQRCSSASVTVGGEVVGSIGRGIMVLLGISRDDTQDDADYIVRKIINTRLYENPDNDKPWSKSVKDLELEVLVVSQFTLYAVMKGNKPDFHTAMGGDTSRPFYERIVGQLKAAHHEDKIKEGQFGAMMSVSLTNEGPVTLTFDSQAR